jgi:hypothetical protein
MINAASDFNAGTVAVDGAPYGITPDQNGGNVNMEESAPVKPSPLAPDGNTGKTKTIEIQGEGNLVGQRSQYIDIYGNYNRVFSETTNIKIQGSNNIVEAGLENVTLINTNDITVTESNVTYIDGLPANNNVEVLRSNSTAELDVRTYLLDGSSATVYLTFAIPTTDFIEGQLFFVKAIDITNVCRVIIAGGTIDGAANYNFTTVDDGIEMLYSDGNFYIVSNKNSSGGGGSGLTQPEVEGLI